MLLLKLQNKGVFLKTGSDCIPSLSLFGELKINSVFNSEIKNRFGLLFGFNSDDKSQGFTGLAFGDKSEIHFCFKNISYFYETGKEPISFHENKKSLISFNSQFFEESQYLLPTRSEILPCQKIGFSVPLRDRLVFLADKSEFVSIPGKGFVACFLEKPNLFFLPSVVGDKFFKNCIVSPLSFEIGNSNNISGFVTVFSDLSFLFSLEKENVLEETVFFDVFNKNDKMFQNFTFETYKPFDNGFCNVENFKRFIVIKKSKFLPMEGYRFYQF